MKPYYGAINDEGLWWDGVTWRKHSHGTDLTKYETLFMQLETMHTHDAANRHPDGVFKCPRCRRMHFIPDQFDYLCDGCATVLATHPNSDQTIKNGLALWAKKRASLYGDQDILNRVKERDLLWKIATTEIIPPLSTKSGRDYIGALPPPSPELNGKFKRVGFWTAYNVYRCHWNTQEPEKSGWTWQSTRTIE